MTIERWLRGIAGLFVLVSVLLAIPAAVLVPWLVQNDYSMTTSASFASGYDIFCNIISMSGILCFVYAFKVKLNEKFEKNECVRCM